MKKLLVLAVLAIGCGAPTVTPPMTQDERYEVVSHQEVKNSIRPFGITVLRDKQTKKEITVFVTRDGGVSLAVPSQP